MSIKALPAVGLFGWDSTNEVWVRVAVDSSGNISISDTDIDTILSEVQNATYGLSALETLVDEIETYLKHATYGLAALDSDLGTLLTRLSATRAGYLDNLSAGATALEATLTAIKGTSWSDETLKAIKDAVDAITPGDPDANADAVWDEATSGHVTVGSFGKLLADINTETGTHPTLAEIEASNLDQAISTTESNIRGGSETLESLKVYVDLIDDATNGLAAIKAEVEGIGGITPATQANVSTEIDQQVGDYASQTNLQTLLAALGIPDTLNKPLYTCLITDRLDHATYGLSALETIVDDLEGRLTATRAGYLDELDFDLDARLGTPVADLATDIAGIKIVADNIETDTGTDIPADFDRHLTPLDFWGDPIATVQISTSTAVKSLGTITVPTLPTGATIWKVQLIGFISHVVDTSGSDNAINGAVSIQVQDDGGGSWKTGYDLQDNALMVDVSQSKVSPGIAIVGNLNNDDLGGAGYVDGADIYNVQITTVVSDGDNLDLYGLQFGLRVWIY